MSYECITCGAVVKEGFFGGPRQYMKPGCSIKCLTIWENRCK